MTLAYLLVLSTAGQRVVRAAFLRSDHHRHPMSWRYSVVASSTGASLHRVMTALRRLGSTSRAR